MSLFDLQDVCIAIGSIATLDLPMVVDLIGIYGLKGPYCTLTTTNWFLQALSVIPRGSWGDVARRFTMIRWACPEFSTHRRPSPLSIRRRSPPCAAAAAASLRRKIVSGQFDEENPFVLISSVLLVQADEGVSFLVVDRIGDIYRNLPRRADVIVTTVGARHKCQQDRKRKSEKKVAGPPPYAEETTTSRAGRAMDDLMSRAGRATRARWPGDYATAGRDVRAPLAAAACRAGRRRARWSHVLSDGWPLDVARDGRRWAALFETKRRCWPHDCAHGGARRRWSAALVAAACAPCGARDFVDGGRRPAAAPANLRRCRDGWSEFF
ncbi:hypothetical protein F511_21308 [Dorcoceras hygrometricum]|uniref:Acyl-CoA dehydrogenase-related protein n=1 Tax=Dorcoceras hygrometricum TaxID=472368 RepID=A0A2Z7BC66_9LAMI|nr:hypothetical protein F511_21308 [Dorcoceras hygrometricum]